MNFIGSYLGISKATEVLILTIIGICCTIFDASILDLNSNLSKVWSLALDPEKFSRNSQVLLKYILSGVVLVRTFSIHLYLAFYIVMLWPAVFEERPNLLLPWLTVGVVKSLFMGAISFTTGLYICSIYGIYRPACIDFFIAQMVDNAPSFYAWFTVLSYYRELKAALVTSKIRSIERNMLTTEEVAIRRRLARSINAESALSNKSFKQLRSALLFGSIGSIKKSSRSDVTAGDSRSLDSLLVKLASEAYTEDNLSGNEEYVPEEDPKIVTLVEKTIKALEITSSDIQRAKEEQNKRPTPPSTEKLLNVFENAVTKFSTDVLPGYSGEIKKNTKEEHAEDARSLQESSADDILLLEMSLLSAKSREEENSQESDILETEIASNIFQDNSQTEEVEVASRRGVLTDDSGSRDLESSSLQETFSMGNDQRQEESYVNDEEFRDKISTDDDVSSDSPKGKDPHYDDDASPDTNVIPNNEEPKTDEDHQIEKVNVEFVERNALSDDTPQKADDIPQTEPEALKKEADTPVVTINTPQKTVDTPHITEADTTQMVVNRPQKTVDVPQKAENTPPMTVEKEDATSQNADEMLKTETDTPQVVVNTPQKAVDAPETVVDTQQKAADVPQMIADTSQKAVDIPQKTDTPQRAVVGTEQMAMDTPQKMVDAPYMAVDTQQKALDASQVAVDTQQKAVDTPQMVVDMPQKAANGSQMAVQSRFRGYPATSVENFTTREIRLRGYPSAEGSAHHESRLQDYPVIDDSIHREGRLRGVTIVDDTITYGDSDDSETQEMYSVLLEQLRKWVRSNVNKRCKERLINESDLSREGSSEETLVDCDVQDDKWVHFLVETGLMKIVKRRTSKIKEQLEELAHLREHSDSESHELLEDTDDEDEDDVAVGEAEAIKDEETVDYDDMRSLTSEEDSSLYRVTAGLIHARSAVYKFMKGQDQEKRSTSSSGESSDTSSSQTERSSIVTVPRGRVVLVIPRDKGSIDTDSDKVVMVKRQITSMKLVEQDDEGSQEVVKQEEKASVQVSSQEGQPSVDKREEKAETPVRDTSLQAADRQEGRSVVLVPIREEGSFIDPHVKHISEGEESELVATQEDRLEMVIREEKSVAPIPTEEKSLREIDARKTEVVALDRIRSSSEEEEGSFADKKSVASITVQEERPADEKSFQQTVRIEEKPASLTSVSSSLQLAIEGRSPEFTTIQVEKPTDDTTLQETPVREVEEPSVTTSVRGGKSIPFVTDKEDTILSEKKLKEKSIVHMTIHEEKQDSDVSIQEREVKIETLAKQPEQKVEDGKERQEEMSDISVTSVKSVELKTADVRAKDVRVRIGKSIRVTFQDDEIEEEEETEGTDKVSVLLAEAVKEAEKAPMVSIKTVKAVVDNEREQEIAMEEKRLEEVVNETTELLPVSLVVEEKEEIEKQSERSEAKDYIVKEKIMVATSTSFTDIKEAVRTAASEENISESKKEEVKSTVGISTVEEEKAVQDGVSEEKDLEGAKVEEVKSILSEKSTITIETDEAEKDTKETVQIDVSEERAKQVEEVIAIPSPVMTTVGVSTVEVERGITEAVKTGVSEEKGKQLEKVEAIQSAETSSLGISIVEVKRGITEAVKTDVSEEKGQQVEEEKAIPSPEMSTVGVSTVEAERETKEAVKTGISEEKDPKDKKAEKVKGKPPDKSTVGIRPVELKKDFKEGIRRDISEEKVLEGKKLEEVKSVKTSDKGIMTPKTLATEGDIKEVSKTGVSDEKAVDSKETGEVKGKLSPEKSSIGINTTEVVKEEIKTKPESIAQNTCASQTYVEEEANIALNARVSINSNSIVVVLPNIYKLPESPKVQLDLEKQEPSPPEESEQNKEITILKQPLHEKKSTESNISVANDSASDFVYMRRRSPPKSPLTNVKPSVYGKPTDQYAKRKPEVDRRYPFHNDGYTQEYLRKVNQRKTFKK